MQPFHCGAAACAGKPGVLTVLVRCKTSATSQKLRVRTQKLALTGRLIWQVSQAKQTGGDIGGNCATSMAASMVVLISQRLQERLNFFGSVHVDMSDEPQRDIPIISVCQNRLKRRVIFHFEIREKSEANTFLNGLKMERRAVGNDRDLILSYIVVDPTLVRDMRQIARRKNEPLTIYDRAP